MRHIRVVGGLAALLALTAASPALATAQSTMLKVIGSDSVPVPFAWVVVQGGAGNVTDERGQLTLGPGKHKTLTVEVRRIGYQPWYGKLDLPDTAAVLTVSLMRVAQALGAVAVTDSSRRTAPVNLRGFYDRWLMREKGALSATFIGPEQIERRNPGHTTDMLSGVLGISLRRTPLGGLVAENASGTCFMTVMVDGRTVCPPMGCHTSAATSQGATQIDSRASGPPLAIDQVTVDINQVVDVDALSAIEVYARGGNMPISLQATDNACGVVAFWTGSRR